MTECVLKFDHFENIHKLVGAEKVFEGAPNFRQVPGLPVFGTGQPTLESFRDVLSFVKSSGYNRVVWFNMRQEPVVYVNGSSFTPRTPDRLNENMEMTGVTAEQLQAYTAEFVSSIKDKAEALGEQVKYYRDTFAEHPEDRINKEHIVPLKSIYSLDEAYEQLRKESFDVTVVKLPIVDEKAPAFEDLDKLVTAVRGLPAITAEAAPTTSGASESKLALFFNCQMGKGRTTTGMTCACLVAEALAGKTLASISHEKVAHRLVELKEGKNVPYVASEAAEALRRGEFNVIRDLLKRLEGSEAAKAQLDRVLDLTGSPFGLQNLREVIIWTKSQHDSSKEQARPYWKHISKNFVERYYVLICFTVYVRAEATKETPFSVTFKSWMDSHSELISYLAEQLPSFNWE